MKLIFVLPLFVLLLAGCAKPEPPKETPGAAIDRYKNLSAEYSEWLGVFLNKCQKADSIVYSVSGSGGFSGVTYYYDGFGKQVGPAFYWDDIVEPNEPKPPVDTSDYNCTELNRSKELGPPEPPPTPDAVEGRYDTLASEYANGLGAILHSCTKNGEKAFIVVGSGGFSGETFIYDSQGSLVQQFSWDDMVEPGEAPPPFDSSQYGCKMIKTSKS